MSIVKYQALTQSNDTKERKKGCQRISDEIIQLDENQSSEAIKLIKKSGYLINEKSNNAEYLEKVLKICDKKFKEDPK